MKRGYHFSLICNYCNAEDIKDDENLKAFAKMLMTKIGTTSKNDPRVINFNGESSSLIQLFDARPQDSSLGQGCVGHFWYDIAQCHFDIFSCIEFDVENVIDTVKEFFHPLSIQTTPIHRQA